VLGSGPLQDIAAQLGVSPEQALPSRHQPLARSSSSATTSSTAIRCSSITVRASSACSATCRRWT
jgi:hypothetical protein